MLRFDPILLHVIETHEHKGDFKECHDERSQP
jgi:hypothetical protein